MKSSFVKVSVLILLIGTLSGCVSLDMFGEDTADRSLSTGSVNAPRQNTPMSDDVTVRNAVSSADLTRLKDDTLPWANAATGSAGVVSKISENNKDGITCRDFSTTRHSYNGIANYYGQTCRNSTGQWLMTRFDLQ